MSQKVYSVAENRMIDGSPDPWSLQESIWLQQQLDAARAAGDSDKITAIHTQILSRPVTGVPRNETGLPKVVRTARLRLPGNVKG